MRGPVFAGASHVTRTLSVEPGIPATIGAAGADGDLDRTSSTVIVTDLAATLLASSSARRPPSPSPSSCSSSRSRGATRPYLAGGGDDGERVLAGPFEAVGQPVAVRVRGRDRAADVLPRPRVLVHAQRDERLRFCRRTACCCSRRSCPGLRTTSSLVSPLRSSPAPRTSYWVRGSKCSAVVAGSSGSDCMVVILALLSVSPASSTAVLVGPGAASLSFWVPVLNLRYCMS